MAAASRCGGFGQQYPVSYSRVRDVHPALSGTSFSYRSQLRGTALANHEQDQTSGTGPAGIEAHDDEDAGTFRWPSAETEEVPGPGADGAPPAGPAMDWQHALGASPEPDDAPGLYGAPF